MATKKKTPQGLEITTFRLRGYSCSEFIAANHDIDDWLAKQPGFQSRYIAAQSDGKIVDMLIWNSVEEGTKAMQQIMQATAQSQVHEMIDQRTVSWSCIPLHHRIHLSDQGQ